MSFPTNDCISRTTPRLGVDRSTPNLHLQPYCLTRAPTLERILELAKQLGVGACVRVARLFCPAGTTDAEVRRAVRAFFGWLRPAQVAPPQIPVDKG